MKKIICYFRGHVFLNPQVKDKTMRYGWAWWCRRCKIRREWFPDE